MEYLNEFHRQSIAQKMKQIEEWRKIPINNELVLKQQRERERISKEMEDQFYPFNKSREQHEKK